MTQGPESTPRVPDAIERSIVIQTHARIPEQVERQRTIVIPHDGIADLEAYKLRQLGDPRVRYNNSGELFIKRFRDTNIQLELPQLPESVDIGFDKVDIVKRLWPRFPDVETAIRATRHIADKYDKKYGNETISLLNVHRTVQRFGRELQKPADERMPWSQLKEEAAREVVKEGLDTAYNQDKTDLGEMIVKAVSEDVKGRENPSRTRLMLAHLYPRITKMLLANTHKYNKYRYLESVLYQEREKDRFPFEVFIKEVNRLKALEDPRNREHKNLERRIRRQAYAMLRPSRIRVAPYVQIAAEARYKLFGHNLPEEKANLVRYVGGEYAEELMQAPTFYELEPEDRTKRLIEIADAFDRYLKYTDEQLPDAIAA